MSADGPVGTGAAIAFTDVATFCEAVVRVPVQGAQATKVKKVTSFLQFCRPKLDHLFPILRLLLPQLDRERGSYGIKESVLARIFIRVLGLGDSSSDAVKLKNYRAPKGAGHQSDAGDFAAVLYSIVLDRGYPDGGLHVNDINRHLDAMAAAGGSGGRNREVEKILMDMFKLMSAVQVKWLVRIILKDMRLGLGEATLFRVVHPDAKELYEVNANLRKVCELLRNPEVRLNEIAISLFDPFKPMLAERGQMDRVEAQMGHRPFFVEVKYDGERVQIHKNQQDAYKYFSRNGNDFTDDFGRSPSDPSSFTTVLSQCLASHVQDVILDGEMCAYNHQTESLTQKGEKMNIRGLKGDDPMFQQCFYAYDILLLNGQVLCNKPLRDRLTMLSSALVEQPGRVHFAERTTGSTQSEVVEALNQAIDRRDEGIVLKECNSVYKPNARSGGGWLKIKPDYSNQLTDQCDLIVMGGYYGSGRKGRGIISHFLLGLASGHSDKQDELNEIHSFCRVGSGYSMRELYDLLQRLEPHFVKPKWSHGPTGTDYRVQVDGITLRTGKEKPDVILSPKKSVILQINAAEIIKSDVYYTRCTLRFPRVEKIRSDKSWTDCMTRKELETLRNEAQGKLCHRHLTLSDPAEDGPPLKRRRKGASSTPTVGLAKAFASTNLVQVMVESHDLKDKVIVIEPTSASLKIKLEAIVTKHGGTVEQNPDPGRTFCYVETGLKMKAKSVVKSGKFDVVRHAWLLECDEKFRMFGPSDMVWATPKLQDQFRLQYDPFGDPYASRATLSSLKHSMNQVHVQGKECKITRELLASFESDHFPNPLKSGIFRQLLFYADRYAQVGIPKSELDLHPLEEIELVAQFYGGKMTTNIGTDPVTHVLVHKSDSARLLRIKSLRRLKSCNTFHIVADTWIEACVDEGRIVPEVEFEL